LSVERSVEAESAQLPGRGGRYLGMSAVKPLAETPKIAALLPRDESAKLDGSKLKIVRDLSRGPRRVAITDGERIAIYSPIPPPEYEHGLGFVETLEAEPRKVVRHYTETGMYGSVNCVALTDGKHKALFVPVEIVSRDAHR
jgi:hypothetical protein